ncbi:MAG: hypothetical protein HN580_14045 [Deltaproteobacteria bacterium]|jgi:hypothetical protein|nr:hypothetical protein [Deltaproteobacteria bacterium]MBT4269071.1 hypothetical protein [Deltaproteobacteria bacterium]MBT4638113.1 hypothetical protein [Deltaproteobacteria bacterium]MBT6500023.1 hypothetical protein [Deltaproteobacteria bacterium]MBT6612554.1 hypothetical protein [Deltaproteobacteria bacterium]
MKAKRVGIYLALVVAILAIVSGCHRRFGHDNGPERVMEHIDDHVEDLNLSVKQNTLYQELRIRLVKDLEKMKAEHIVFRDQFKAKANDENADLSEVTGLIREKSKEIPTSVALYLDYVEEFYAILDQTQQNELKADFRKKMNRHWD